MSANKYNNTGTTPTLYEYEKEFAWFGGVTTEHEREGEIVYRQDYIKENGDSMVVISMDMLTERNAHFNKLLLHKWNAYNNGVLKKKTVNQLEVSELIFNVSMAELLEMTELSDRHENRAKISKSIMALKDLNIIYHRIKANGSLRIGKFSLYSHVAYDSLEESFRLEITPEHLRQIVDTSVSRYMAIPPKFKSDKALGLYNILTARGQGIDTVTGENILVKSVSFVNCSTGMHLHNKNYKSAKRTIDRCFKEIEALTGIKYTYKYIDGTKDKGYVQQGFISKNVKYKPKKIIATGTSFEDASERVSTPPPKREGTRKERPPREAETVQAKVEVDVTETITATADVNGNDY